MSYPCRVYLQCVHSGLSLSYSKPQFLHFMESFLINGIKTKVVRKLSSVSLNYLQTSLYPRGENMKIFHAICVANPNVVDTYYTDDEGIDRLVECANQRPKKEVHRY